MAQKTQTVLITGASAGIGLELAKLFAEDQYNLLLVARSAPRLSELAAQLQQQFGITAKAFPLDLASPAAPQSLFDQLARENIAVDVLVNNAGFGKLGAFSDV